jgi:hypothetical protein
MKQLLITTTDGNRAILNPDHISEIIESRPGLLSIQIANPDYSEEIPKNTSYLVAETLEGISGRIHEASTIISTQWQGETYQSPASVKFPESVPPIAIELWSWWNDCKFGSELETKKGLFGVMDSVIEDGNPIALLTLVAYRSGATFKTRNYSDYVPVPNWKRILQWNLLTEGEKIIGRMGEYTVSKVVKPSRESAHSIPATLEIHLTVDPTKKFETDECANFLSAWAGVKV